jgi:hypothetical protein
MLRLVLVNGSRGLCIQQKVVQPHTRICTIAASDKFLYVLPAMKRTEKLTARGTTSAKAGMDPFCWSVVSDDSSHWAIDARMDACGKLPKPDPAVLIVIAKHNYKANWKCVPVG